MATSFGHVTVFLGADEDDDEGWQVEFDSSAEGDEPCLLDGTHETAGDALNAAVRWARQRGLTLAPITATVQRRQPWN